jgi:catechol 2,3-dioxygenase-like lactoylglutathione lyase family enzyme
MKPRLDAIGMVVEDMAKSLSFYRELGLEVPPEADDAPHVDAELPGGLRLMWDTVETVRSIDPEWQPPLAGGPKIALAFRLDTPDDVDEVYLRLRKLGHEGHKDPWDADWGMRYAVIVDPDGNHVDLFSPST